MSATYKPLKHLYYQFIKDTPFEGTTIDWHCVAEALQRSDMIRLVPDNSGQAQYKGYIETMYMREIPKEKFKATVDEIIRTYAKEMGLL